VAVRQPRYGREEFARRGDEIYETQVRPQVEADNHGKIVAFSAKHNCEASDIETGDFEVDKGEIDRCYRWAVVPPGRANSSC